MSVHSDEIYGPCLLSEEVCLYMYMHCAKNVVYARVYFCVYFAYTINIPRVVCISSIHLVYVKNPEVTITHCAYSRSITNTHTAMNYATHPNLDNLHV